MIAFDVLLILIAGALCVLALIAIVNALVFPRLGGGSMPTALPLVSLLVPARDEAGLIAETVRWLLGQTYPHLELLILDDASGDGTAKLARAAAGDDSRCRVLAGTPLPEDWMGKNWACHQLAQASAGEWLIFTDADVRWEPAALGALLAQAERQRADLLTVWPTQESDTWGERLVVPLLSLAALAYLPTPLVHHSLWPAFAAANGQCLAFRRAAYVAIDGHVGVRSTVLEDVWLARHIKRAGRRLRMADGAGLVDCRMYRNWKQARDGLAKSLLAGFGNSLPALLAAAVFHWLVFLGPWLWLLAGVPRRGWPLSPLALIALGIGVRALTAAVSRQRIGDALLMPISVLAMTRVAIQAAWWHVRYGGPLWKGRVVPARKGGR